MTSDETRRKPDADAEKHEPRPDVVSDPSLADEEGSEWAGEGGAVEEGPATHTGEDGAT